MMIAFVGLPGTGKTYLAKRLSARKNIPFVILSGRGEKFLYAFKFIYKNFKIFIYLIKIIFKETWSKPKLLWHKITFLLFGAMAREEKSHKFKFSIIDEGIFEFLFFSLHERLVSVAEINNDIKKLNTLPNRKFYLVKSSKSSRVIRMKNRNRFPRSSFGSKYVAQYHETIEQNAILLEKIMEDKDCVTIIWNKSNNSIPRGL